MRRALALLAALLLAAPAGAQAPEPRAPEAQPTPEGVAVPVPEEGGVLYWRSGPRQAGPGPQTRALARADVPSAAALARPATRLDLLTMELRLRQALDGSLARALALQGGLRTAGLGGAARRPVIVLPGQAALAPPTLGPPETLPPLPPAPPPTLGVTPPAPALAPLPRAAPPEGPVVIRDVERALLDVGLFRAVGVQFEFDRAELLPAARAALDAVGEVLVRHPALRLEVQGHTDSVGRAGYNQQLSEARAEAVRHYLVETFALAPERVEARGFGQEQPIASNASPTGRALNRRVDFVVLEAADAPPEALPEEPVGDRLRRIVEEELRRAREGG